MDLNGKKYQTVIVKKDYVKWSILFVNIALSRQCSVEFLSQFKQFTLEAISILSASNS